MCIMEVRPGQRTATVAQAMAHNTSTIERDLDMFRKLLQARKEGAHLEMVEKAQKLLGEAYAIFLEQFGEFVAEEVNPDNHTHSHTNPDNVEYKGQWGRWSLYDANTGSGTFVVDETDVRNHHDHGHERTLVEQAHHDAQLARKYETR